MIDIVEILTHWYAGRSQNELAASLGVDRKTLRKYTGPARVAGIEPGGPPMAEADWRALDASVASVRRWVRANLPEDARRAQVTVLRDCPPAATPTAPGPGGCVSSPDPPSWFSTTLPCASSPSPKPTTSTN